MHVFCSSALHTSSIWSFYTSPQRHWMFSKVRTPSIIVPSIRNMASIATLQRISAKSLSEKILEEKEAQDPTFAVIDVRDDGTTSLSALTSPS